MLVRQAEQRPQGVHEILRDLEERGEHPFVIHFRGSTPLTALSYAQAFVELKDQLDVLGLTPRAIFFSSATGGIQAGMELGKRLVGSEGTALLGVTPGFPAMVVKDQVVELANAAARLAGWDIRLDPRATSASWMSTSGVTTSCLLPSLRRPSLWQRRSKV